MQDEGLAMALECVTPADQSDWGTLQIIARVRRDPEDPGSVQVQYLTNTIDDRLLMELDFTLPRWKQWVKFALHL